MSGQLINLTLQYYNLTTFNNLLYMQRYSDKVYQRTPKINESSLFDVIQEELHLSNSFRLSSNVKQCSIETSRGFPLTLTKQKCKNCQRLEKALTLLTNQLLNIEKNILEKEENLNNILADKSQTIEILQAKLQAFSEKNQLNHFSSTFYTEHEAKTLLLPQNQSKNNIQDNCSIVSQKKNVKHSFVFAYNIDVVPCKNRQKAQSSRLNQNISPNSQINIKDKVISKLKFQNQTLKDYNSTLLAQLQNHKPNPLIKPKVYAQVPIFSFKSKEYLKKDLK